MSENEYSTLNSIDKVKFYSSFYREYPLNKDVVLDPFENIKLDYTLLSIRETQYFVMGMTDSLFDRCVLLYSHFQYTNSYHRLLNEWISQYPHKICLTREYIPPHYYSYSWTHIV